MTEKRDITYLLYRDELYPTEMISFIGGTFKFQLIAMEVPISMFRDFKLQTLLDEVYLMHDNNYTSLYKIQITDIDDDNIVCMYYTSYPSPIAIKQPSSSAKKFREYNIKKLMKNEI